LLDVSFFRAHEFAVKVENHVSFTYDNLRDGLSRRHNDSLKAL
jgi:hypothetical protein